MAIRTLPSQEKYSNKKSRGGGTEPGRKLKKLRSVKVANLDRLRLSMRREKLQFNPSSSSESSSSPMSGTYSPNYMKATTSSSARKEGRSNPRAPERINSPASRGKFSSKFSDVSEEQCSDPVGVNIPADIKSGKSLRRVSSMKKTKKLSSMKSMKIRAKYSQFPDVGITEPGTSSLQIPEVGDNTNASDDQSGIVRVEPKQKGLLQRSISRSRSIRLMRLKSVRSSRRPKSRFHGRATMQTSFEAKKSNSEPHYMKATTSQEARKYSAKGLTRTSSWGPLKILAKIPSLRPRRSKVRKQLENNELQGTYVNRATCSSVLKSSKFPDHIELKSGELHTEGIPSFHVCPYNYCSLHGHHNNVPSLPLKEFISAKRQSVNDQKGKQKLENRSRKSVIHSKSATETNQLEQTVDSESPAVKEVINATSDAHDVEDTGMDFLVNVYAKPRKKWAIEGTSKEDAEALNGSNCVQFRYYEWRLEDTLGEASRLNANEPALNEGTPGFSACNIESSEKSWQQTTRIAVPDLNVKLPDNGPTFYSIDKTLNTIGEEVHSSPKDPSHITTIDSEARSGGSLINILSNKQKYSSIWHLIGQQFISSEESMVGNLGVKSLNEDENNQGAWKVDFDQTAAIKLVQQALDGILQHDGKSSDQQATPGEKILIPAFSSEENFRETGVVVTEKPSLESEYAMHKVEQRSEASQEKGKLDEGKMPGRNISKSLSKLRKLIVTAKFIKAMENLRKINPGKPRYLSSEPTTEEERVYLRHMSMNERKYEEEWMLDFALRKAISRLDPDEQRRVALLVEAFETVNPNNKEKIIKCYPVKGVKGETAPGIELAYPVNEERELVDSNQEISISEEQVLKKQDDETQRYHKGSPMETSLREDHVHVTSATGNESLKKTDEPGILLESSENNTTSNDREFGETVTGNKVCTRTLEVSSQFPSEDSEVKPARIMSTVLSDQQKYTSMWNMIYQHITSSQSSTEGEQGVKGFEEKDQGSDANSSEETNDLDSTQIVNSTDRAEDEDNKTASHENLELNQSAAIKLVKEAVNSILQRYELSSDQQSITDPNKATKDVKRLLISTPPYSTEESTREGNKRVIACSEPDVLEKTNEASPQQTEANESKAGLKKMSKSLSKLKKAIVTAKFIKAMERLRKIRPQKPRHLFSEAASEEERTYLRHQSMDRRKNGEEWMLDYALRQVISKLAPDLQRRVALLVEAFETVNPGQKEKGIGTSSYPLKDKPMTDIRLENPTNKKLKQFVDSERERSIFDDNIPRKQDDGLLLSSEGIPDEISLKENNDHQASTTAEELSPGDPEATTNSKVTSLPSTGDSESGTAGVLTTLLSDKQKYTNMWHLIFQHVVPSEASASEEQIDNEVNEDEQHEDANHDQEINKLESSQSHENTYQKEDEIHQGRACMDHELDQSAAVKLVKEAIDAILQSHERISHAQSVQVHDITADSGGDLHNIGAAASTKETSIGWKRVEKHRSSEGKDMNENALVQKKVEANELNKSQRKTSKSFSKLKKMFLTAKFMKAMERMRRISPRQPRYLTHEASSEEERVNLRHQDINERRNTEEWMLDYALRDVISNLAPEQQRRVAMLVEAFETITPKQKASGIGNYMKAEVAPTIELGSSANDRHTSKLHDHSILYDDHIGPSKKFTLFGTAAQLKSSGEEHTMEISNFRTKPYEDILDSDVNNVHIFHQISSKGGLVRDRLNMTERKGIDSKSKSESLQEASLSEDSKQDHEANVTKNTCSVTQKQTSLWHLIYQQAKSDTTVEAGNNKDQLRSGKASSEIPVDSDDSDASSVTSELTETEAVKMVREALNDVLAVPQELDNELQGSNVTAANNEDQRAGQGEKSAKTLSRGYSKLRKLIICNKFIKAMENAKMQKSCPQKLKHPILNSEPDSGKTNRKPCAMSEEKSKDELMLDYALQKAIAGLAPIQQRRVSMLIEAFEKVNPDIEETRKRFSSSDAEYLSPVGNAKGTNESIFESSPNSSQLPTDFNLIIQGSVKTSKREVATDSTAVEKHKEKPITSREDWRSNSTSSITASISDLNDTPSNVSKDPTEVNAGDMPLRHVLQKGMISTDDFFESEVATSEKPPHSEDLDDEENPSTKNDSSLDKVRHTSLWRLLVQHVKSDILEETTKHMSAELEANALLERDSNDQYKLSPEAEHDKEMNIQVPFSMRFEFQEKEAIKVVQEALDVILNCDDQSMSASTTSQQDVCTEKHGTKEETSPATQEIGVETIVDTAEKPKEQQTSSQEKISNSYSKLSKVILCKRFIKAMDKMRKIKPQSPLNHSQQLQLEGEGFSPMRQNVSNQRKNWEEWMLDNAMQQVVGKLTPAQKKKVLLLVQAFETVSLHPEPDTSWRGKMAG